MPKATILLADNHQDFAESSAEILRHNGYKALIAFTAGQAREIADQGGIDLAILDVRLTNDDDEKDRSGLLLAQEIDPAIPKILLTAYPTVDILRQALQPAPHGQSLATDVLDKSEGVEALLSSIERILASLQPTETVNIELTINCDFDSFSTEEKARVLRLLRELLDVPGEIPVVAIEPGSTKLTITLTLEQAEQLFWLYERGALDELNIKDAKIIGNEAAAAIVCNKAQSNAYDVFPCDNSEDKPAEMLQTGEDRFMKRSRSHRPDLFLCHSTVDKEFVRRLARDLHDLSVYAWFDEWELAPGDSLHDSIGRAIEESHYVGVVLSPASVDSHWCKKELNQALSRETRSGKKVVIPIRYRAAEMPAFLEDKLYVDFSEEYTVPLTLLAAHIHSLDQRTIREALSAESPRDVGKVVKNFETTWTCQ